MLRQDLELTKQAWLAAQRATRAHRYIPHTPSFPMWVLEHNLRSLRLGSKQFPCLATPPKPRQGLFTNPNWGLDRWLSG